MIWDQWNHVNGEEKCIKACIKIINNARLFRIHTRWPLAGTQCWKEFPLSTGCKTSPWHPYMKLDFEEYYSEKILFPGSSNTYKTWNAVQFPILWGMLPVKLLFFTSLKQHRTCNENMLTDDCPEGTETKNAWRRLTSTTGQSAGTYREIAYPPDCFHASH